MQASRSPLRDFPQHTVKAALAARKLFQLLADFAERRLESGEPGALLLDERAFQELLLLPPQGVCRLGPSEQVQGTCNDPRPAGLVARAETRTVVTVEVLIKSRQ